MVGKSKTGAASPMGFILGFGIVSMLMDIVYEAALSVQGPLLYSVGATAAVASASRCVRLRVMPCSRMRLLAWAAARALPFTRRLIRWVP